MSKTRYYCTKCGKSFTTGSGARRHVKRVEKGVGMAVTEASYAIGLQSRVFSPAIPGKVPTFEERIKTRGQPPIILESDEFTRGFWRRAGELLCEEMFQNQETKNKIREIGRTFILRAMNEIRKDELSESKRDAEMRSVMEVARTFQKQFGSLFNHNE